MGTEPVGSTPEGSEPSEQGPPPPVDAGTWNGEGFLNSGLMFGGDFVAPLNNRWSIQTGFNYLIPDVADGAAGAREESWNVGINLMWHFRRNAKQGQSNPHAPLFNVADNGSLFIDEVP